MKGKGKKVREKEKREWEREREMGIRTEDEKVGHFIPFPSHLLRNQNQGFCPPETKRARNSRK